MRVVQPLAWAQDIQLGAQISRIQVLPPPSQHKKGRPHHWGGLLNTISDRLIIRLYQLQSKSSLQLRR